MAKKIAVALLALSLTACRTVCIEPRLPDFEIPAIDYSAYDKNSVDDLQRLVAMQDDIISRCRNFFAELRK